MGTRRKKRINAKKRKGKHPSSRKQHTRKMRGGDLTCSFDAEILKQIDTAVGKSGILGEGAYGKAFVVLEKINTGTDTQALVELQNTKYVVKELKISYSKDSESIENDYNNARKEAEILQQLSTNPHYNILKYIGCNDLKTPIFYLVTEYNEGYISLEDFINNTVSSNKDGFELTRKTTNEYIKDNANKIKDNANKFVSSIIQNNAVMQNAILTNCIRQLYEGLYAIHERGVFHRDIKPANIIINPLTGHIKYIDFGLSITVKDVESKNIGFGGTPYYMPYKGKVKIEIEIESNEKVKVPILDIYFSNVEEAMPNVLIYLDYWALALTIYIMLFCRKNLFFQESYDRPDFDSDEERYTNGWDGNGDEQTGGNGQCVDNILNKDIFKFFYAKGKYYPYELEDDFTKIDTLLDTLKIPHYMNVSDILYTVEGKKYIDNLLKMYKNFMEKYNEMKTPK